MLNKVAWVVVGILFAAAAYELSLALRHAMSPDREWILVLVAAGAMLAGAVLVLRRVAPAGLFAPAAAFFVTARLYTGDPYYAPDFRAYGGGGAFSVLLLALGVAAGVTTHFWRRTAPFESVVLLVVLMFMALFMSTGH
jgi:hypothetical protein